MRRATLFKSNDGRSRRDARPILRYYSLNESRGQPSGTHCASGEPTGSGSNNLAAKRSLSFGKRGRKTVEVTKALAALKPLYGQDNVEIITTDGNRVRGIVRSMKTTQALTTPSLKMELAGGEIVKIPFTIITEIIDHNK